MTHYSPNQGAGAIRLFSFVIKQPFSIPRKPLSRHANVNREAPIRGHSRHHLSKGQVPELSSPGLHIVPFEVLMLRQLLTFSALAALATAFCAPALASEITGAVAVSGAVDYSFNSDGSASFFAAAASSPSAQAASVFNSQNSSSVLNVQNGFLYNGNITPAVFSTVVNGKSGTLTMDSLTSEIYTADGPEVFLTGTFDQAGYAEELASVSLLLEGEYIGNDINLLMFKGIAQLSPPITPEPASIALLGTGLIALAGVAWRRKHALAAVR